MMWRLWRPVEGTTYEGSDAGEGRDAHGKILKARPASHADRDRSNNALSNLSWKLRGVNRSHKGEECGTAVLNEEKVLGLRRMAASGQFTHTELAAEFGISITQVGKIIHRR